MRTLFVDDLLPEPGAELELERREAEHLFRVLRAVSGERFRLLDGRGTVAEAEVLPGKVLRIESREKLPEPPRKIHLYFAVPRRNRLDALLPECSELGVWRLHPVVCSRSVSDGGPNERWRLQLIEGCKQSGNPFLPEVAAVEPLAAALKQGIAAGERLYFGSVVPSGGETETADGDIGWVVGPEGGFTPEEEAMMRETGVRPLHLGGYVLRLETAAVCGLAVLRKLLFSCLLPLALLAVSGCGERNAAKHPLVRKGDYYRDNGDAKLAAEFYRRAGDKFPGSAAVRLRLAALCDEALNDPLGAAWYYGEYLRLSPDSGDRETIEVCRRGALDRLSSSDAAAVVKSLSEENIRLRSSLNELKTRFLELQRRSTSGAVNPFRYTVRAGDTPAVIARRHRIGVDSLLRANGLTRTSRLSIGRELIIPTAE